jgi:hypothetical protein
MAIEDIPVDFWSLKSTQLARECRMIAKGDFPVPDETVRTEARLLAEEWQDAIHMPQDEFADQARRASQLAALRKRTIEILVNVYPRE